MNTSTEIPHPEGAAAAATTSKITTTTGKEKSQVATTTTAVMSIGGVDATGNTGVITRTVNHQGSVFQVMKQS